MAENISRPMAAMDDNDTRVKAFQADSLAMRTAASSWKAKLRKANLCMENNTLYDMVEIVNLPDVAPPPASLTPLTPSWATVAGKPGAFQSPAGFHSVQTADQMTTKAQRALNIPTRSSAREEADVSSAKMQARQEYRKMRLEVLAQTTRPRQSCERVNVGADMLTAMYVVGPLTNLKE